MTLQGTGCGKETGDYKIQTLYGTYSV